MFSHKRRWDKTSSLPFLPVPLAPDRPEAGRYPGGFDKPFPSVSPCKDPGLSPLPQSLSPRASETHKEHPTHLRDGS